MFVPESLAAVFSGSAPCAILLSGGNDSEILLRAAVETLGTSGVLSLTADSPLLADFYRKRIREISSRIGIISVFVNVNPLDIPEFRRNGIDRCYLCKSLIYSALVDRAGEMGFTSVMDGTNLDDLVENRPGLKAAEEFGILHPFLQAKMGKTKILELGASLGMTPDGNPSDSCLATRIVPGLEIEAGLLALVEELESFFRPHVKGRVRAGIDSTEITMEYSGGDSDLVSGNRNEAEAVAHRMGYTLRWKLIRPHTCF